MFSCVASYTLYCYNKARFLVLFSPFLVLIFVSIPTKCNETNTLSLLNCRWNINHNSTWSMFHLKFDMVENYDINIFTS